MSFDVSFYTCHSASLSWTAGLGNNMCPLPYCGSKTLGNGSTESSDPLRPGSCCLGVGHGACEKKHVSMEHTGNQPF